MFKFNQNIRIGKIVLSQKSPACFIAEVGVNHNGDFEVAKKLIDAAKYAGADIVKFQTFSADDTMSDKKAAFSYKVNGKVVTERLHAMFERLALPLEWHQKLLRYAQKKNIQFLSTPCHLAAVDLLEDLNVPAYKIGSGDLTSIDLLTAVAQTKKPVLVSTGMARKEEIDKVVAIFQRLKNSNLVLLQCTAVYPAPAGEVNLNRMLSLKERYKTLVGFSDHSEGPEAVLGSIYMGAVVVEKHFTLSKKMAGPDHQFSIEPKELKILIEKIRHAEKLKGSSQLRESKTETRERLRFRRSIVAARDLKAGIKLRQEDLYYKRPGGGVSPFDRDQLIGKIIKRSVTKDSPILLSLVF